MITSRRVFTTFQFWFSSRSWYYILAEEGQEKSNDDSPENNPMYTTVYVGNLAPEASILVPPLIETCKITRLMLLAVLMN